MYGALDPVSLGVNVIMSVDDVSFERSNRPSKISNITIKNDVRNNNIVYSTFELFI